MQASHVTASCVLAALRPAQVPRNAPVKVTEDGPRAWPLPPEWDTQTRGTQMNFLPPSFLLVRPWPCCGHLGSGLVDGRVCLSRDGGAGEPAHTAEFKFPEW